MKNKRTEGLRALVLFSGGLDSILSALILKNIGVNITLLSFKSPFFNKADLDLQAKKIGFPIKIIDFSGEHLKIVKSPVHGYGKNLNPCIDCHGLMLSFAKKIMKKEGYDFVATGEVLGQRLFSQNKKALKVVEEISGLEGELLRPLSAKRLPMTKMEKDGVIDRNSLYSIQGRGRNKQFGLAKKFSISEFPSPAGGCLLTDQGFSIRSKKLIEINSKADPNDFNILRFGRFYPIKKGIIIIGRNEEENNKLIEHSKQNDFLIQLKEIPGPVGLLRLFDKKASKEEIGLLKNKILKHTPKAKSSQNIDFERIKHEKITF